MNRILATLILVCFSLPTSASANPPVQRRAVQGQSVAVDNRLTVVPFAVPVAVPVATLQQPLLLYSYRQYASPGLPLAYGVDQAASDASAPAAGTPPQAASQATSAAAQILVERCSKCHSGSAAKGQLSMVDADGHLLSRLPRQMMLEMVETDSTGKPRMPPGELPKLSPGDVQTLREWAKPPRDAVY